MLLPDDSQRLAIVGRTGSGKTQAAVWHLSMRDFSGRPWIIFDFKGDTLIQQIPGVRTLALKKPPREPGLYVVRPMPHQIDEVDDFLWQVWESEKTGLYFDEGYMVSKCQAFQALLTQGRSKQIPIIVLTQRPIWISRFVWSESDYFQIFTLTNIRDEKIVREFVPRYDKNVLGRYQSFYHDVGEDQTILLDPVPGAPSLLAKFKQLTRRTRAL
jgi:hypothetical protein